MKFELAVTHHDESLTDYTIDVDGEFFGSFFPYKWKEMQGDWGAYVHDHKVMHAASLMVAAPDLLASLKQLVAIAPPGKEVDHAQAIINRLEHHEDQTS